MPRIRSIKPETWHDRKLAKRLSRDARLLYIALWNFADEHARLQGDPQFIKGQAFPYDDDLDLGEIDRLLEDLAAAGRVVRYEHDGDPYLFLPKLAEHQRLEPQKVASKHPAPPDPEPAQVFSDESAPRSDGPAPDAESSTLLYGAGSMEPVAGSRGVALRADDPTTALLAEHVHAYTETPPMDAQAKTKAAIMKQVAEGTSPERIRAGLARMRERRVGPSLLPQLIAECSPVRTPSTTDQRVSGTLALARDYDAQEGR